MRMAGTLFLVATPIGNLQDISARAIETLRSVSLIACEDTRRTSRLINFYRIETPLVSYHEHNEYRRADSLIEKLLNGDSIAVVSDAGTPMINDPGFVLISAAIERGIAVSPIPGPAAFVAAVIASGLATDSIFFGGFLPSRSGERRKRLAEIAAVPATLVFYESPNRLAASLADCHKILGNRNAAYAREITKLHEEFARGDLKSLAERVAESPVKGEIVFMIDRTPVRAALSSETTLAQRVAELTAGGMEKKAALKQTAKEFNVSRSEAYRLLQAEMP